MREHLPRWGLLAHALLASLALTWLAGCGPDEALPEYPRCYSNEACEAHGERCVAGQCAECAIDAQCGSVCQMCVTGQCRQRPGCCEDDRACTAERPHCGDDNRCHECDRVSHCSKLNQQCIDGVCSVPYCRSDDECPRGQSCDLSIEKCQIGEACELVEIYFDTDRSAIRPDQLRRLEHNARCFRAVDRRRERPVRLFLSGFADERGAPPYNVELSEERAAAVKRALAELGLPQTAIEAEGKGEEYPVALDSDETAWRFNRRVEVRFWIP